MVPVLDDCVALSQPTTAARFNSCSRPQHPRRRRLLTISVACAASVAAAAAAAALWIQEETVSPIEHKGYGGCCHRKLLLSSPVRSAPQVTQNAHPRHISSENSALGSSTHRAVSRAVRFADIKGFPSTLPEEANVNYLTGLDSRTAPSRRSLSQVSYGGFGEPDDASRMDDFKFYVWATLLLIPPLILTLLWLRSTFMCFRDCFLSEDGGEWCPPTPSQRALIKEKRRVARGKAAAEVIVGASRVFRTRISSPIVSLANSFVSKTRCLVGASCPSDGHLPPVPPCSRVNSYQRTPVELKDLSEDVEVNASNMEFVARAASEPVLLRRRLALMAELMTPSWSSCAPVPEGNETSAEECVSLCPAAHQGSQSSPRAESNGSNEQRLSDPEGAAAAEFSILQLCCSHRLVDGINSDGEDSIIANEGVQIAPQDLQDDGESGPCSTTATMANAASLSSCGEFSEV